MIVKNILWDFDGVILDSMKVRDWGFREIFSGFNDQLVEKLIDYHNLNGGLSRYVKIRYFYENILNKKITEKEVLEYAYEFSKLMKRELTKRENLIDETIDFLKDNYKKYNFHIVSGSDQEELRFLSKELGISDYFISIHGSPTSKNKLVEDLLKNQGYIKINTCLIGDSLNDYEAADLNDISFYGFNNVNLKDLNSGYISSFENFDLLISKGL